ncbi:MAG: glycerol-3-phosphate dehydrogenase C-terminal domain-containing protein, partial [Planctomycetota bacterium]
SAVADVLALVDEEPALGARLGRSTVIGAEAVHAVRSEMARTLADVALLHTDLATAGDPGADAIDACAALVARELGWDEPRVRREIAALASAPPVVTAEAPAPAGRPVSEVAS